MSDNDFTFQHLETEKDIEEYLEIMRKVFGQNTGVGVFVRKLVYNHPRMALRNHFIGKYHGRVIAGLSLIPIQWSIGGILLKVAEMGNVATLEEYRRKGLIRRLVNEYHRKIADEDYDLSAIEGIPYFYRQFGYDYALTLDEETRISLERLPNCDSGLKISLFTNEDMQEAKTLLAHSQAKLYVHSVRDDQIWRMQQETCLANEYRFEGYTLKENGRMVAYFRVSRRPEDRTLILREATDTDYPAIQAILSFLKETGQKNGSETLVARTSYCDPLTRALVALGAEQEMPPYAWQIRVTDWASLIQRMKPLFESRLASSEYRGLTETLGFNFRRFVVQMVFENGMISSIRQLDKAEQCVIGLNPPASTQLLFGYKSRTELETCYPDFHVRSRYKQLIDVLFPKLPSHIHSAY